MTNTLDLGNRTVRPPGTRHALDVHRIRESVDVDIYYIRPDGVYIH